MLEKENLKLFYWNQKTRNLMLIAISLKWDKKLLLKML